MNAALAELGLAGALAVAVAGSGLWLIRMEHDARQRFVELEELNREQDRLQIDWGRLQLEQSTWATHSRIESLAREQLDLAAPKTEQIVVVSEADDDSDDDSDGDRGDRANGAVAEPLRLGANDSSRGAEDSSLGANDASRGADVSTRLDLFTPGAGVSARSAENSSRSVDESIRERVGGLIRGRVDGAVHERK
jgi:cell division protein FtsL